MLVRYVTVHVFTDRPFGGNPLAVVPDAAGSRGQRADKRFVFSFDLAQAESSLRARMFAPSRGGVEDPATGSACVALGGYLAKRHPRREGTQRWKEGPLGEAHRV